MTASGLPKLLFIGTADELNYLPRLKSCLGGVSCAVDLRGVSTLTEVVLAAKAKECTGVISTSRALLSKLTGTDKPSLDDYAGSLFKARAQGVDTEVVFIPPLKQLVTVNYGEFLTKRYISKLTTPSKWAEVSPFKWEELNASNADSVYALFSSPAAIAISVDIETVQEFLRITEIGYTVLLAEPSGGLSTRSYVLQMNSEWALAWMRKFNVIRKPKIFQNGKYDCAYLSRYNAVPTDWLYDTAHMFHSWYSELPKDLASLGAFFIRNIAFWKHLSESTDRQVQLEYNCWDHWATAQVFVRWMLDAPAWAKTNYVLEFPTVPACHLAEMTGIKQDQAIREVALAEVEADIAAQNTRMAKITGAAGFNSNSHVQVKKLMTALGCGDIAAESSDEKHIEKAAYRHPLNKHVLDIILDIRGKRKLASTYLVAGKDHRGRILYSLNPHYTDSGRLSSREHHFWCGLQIQNIPRDKSVKQTLVADSGFLLGEADLEQAESRDTAYISGDAAYIAAVSGSRDFHSVNASAFFGVPYDQIYSDAAKKTINKVLRDTAKRVNHGVNYNMGAQVLVDTMGLAAIYKARVLLGLPKFWTAIQIAEHLIAAFHRAYPGIKSVFHAGVITEVMLGQLLTSKIINAPAWTRYCFGNPKKNKLDANALIAHVPQSLNAMTLNRAWIKVFREVWMPNKENFKLCAQIHDSILFQYRIGHEHLAEQVKACMEIPVEIKGYDGVTRTFTVPAALKLGSKERPARYWSETE